MRNSYPSKTELIHVLPHTSNPEFYLAGSDIFCLPSYREGFGSAVLNYVHNEKKTPTISTIKNIIFPDKFIEHNTPENQYKEIGMDSLSIADKVLSLLYSEVIPFRDYKKKIRYFEKKS